MRGGAGGIEACLDDLTRLATTVRTVGVGLGELALTVDLEVLPLLDPVTAVLDPLGAAEAGALIAAGVHGPRGLAALAAESLGLAGGVSAAASAYAAADDLAHLAVVRALESLPALAGGLVVAVRAALDTHSATTALQVGLTTDPRAVDAAVLAVGLGRPAAVALGLSSWFDDGRAVLTPHPGPAGADPGGPPRDLTGLLRGLQTRNADVPGAVDVKVLTTVDPDGTVHRRAVVDIPGTKDWSPAAVNPDVTNPGSNLRALSGAATTYADGVLAALTAAGVAPGTEVLFVGHSLGGMVALAAAGRAQAAGYRPAVVTAGSPLGAIAPPPGVPVLALENSRDVVPHLDGAANPAGPDVTTVTVDHPYGTVGDNHGLPTAYIPGAADVDASTDPSVVAARGRLEPFLTADTVETHVYVVTREP